MDDADPEVERSIEPLCHHLREPTPGSGPKLSSQTSFPPALTQKYLQGPYRALLLESLHVQFAFTAPCTNQVPCAPILPSSAFICVPSASSADQTLTASIFPSCALESGPSVPSRTEPFEPGERISNRRTAKPSPPSSLFRHFSPFLLSCIPYAIRSANHDEGLAD